MDSTCPKSADSPTVDLDMLSLVSHGRLVRHCSAVVSVSFSEDVTRALTMTSARSIAMYDSTTGVT